MKELGRKLQMPEIVHWKKIEEEISKTHTTTCLVLIVLSPEGEVPNQPFIITKLKRKPFY
jgi:hypothetical protein